jgi:transcriptional regulator with XRE-family HTH domain
MIYDYDIRKRILLLRKDLGLNQTNFARQCSITSATISEVEGGIRGVGSKTLLQIAKTFSVNLNWLAFGIGPLYIKDVLPQEASDELCRIADLSPQGEAEGLKLLLKNPDLTRRIGISRDDMDWLLTWVRRSPEDLKHMPLEWFLLSLLGRRKAQQDYLEKILADLHSGKSINHEEKES